MPIPIAALALGWPVPVLGYALMVSMGIGFVGASRHTRYGCGNLCPRGAFYDRFVGLVARGRRPLPRWLQKGITRLLMMVVVMGTVVTFLILRPANVAWWAHVGRGMWLMCAITVGVGLVQAMLFHRRAWCVVCPMSFLHSVTGSAKPLKIDAEECVSCRRCEETCPMLVPILSGKDAGQITTTQCIQCRECVAACRKDALKF